jgi:uncharacterized protein YbbC (DUF1343 family)
MLSYFSANAEQWRPGMVKSVTPACGGHVPIGPGVIRHVKIRHSPWIRSVEIKDELLSTALPGALASTYLSIELLCQKTSFSKYLGVFVADDQAAKRRISIVIVHRGHSWRGIG